ncbi:MAG: hypothetical protein J6I96_04060 [Oscillospiraceae bacterium]|nr:hypothetical protein [Oscillospiraceae bacterium]
MKRAYAALCAAMAVMLTGCIGSGGTTVENAQNQVDESKNLAATQNAQLMMQNAQNYCADCGAKGVELKSGRYAGKLDKAGSIVYDGSQSDFDTAMDTYTNGMTKGYYVVMINNGTPVAAYWSESDISSMDFSKEPGDDVVIGKWTN